MTSRIHVVLPNSLLEEIDRIAGPRRRSEYIAETLEQSVLRERQRQAIQETTGILSDDEYPEWSTPEKTSAWVRRTRDLESQRLDEKIKRWNAGE